MLFKRTLSNGKKCQTWTARYRGADGCVIQRPTGCRGKDAAQARLSEWLSLEEKRKAGLISMGELQAAGWACTDIGIHINDYEKHLKARGRSEEYIKKTVRTLRTTCKALQFKRISDFSRTKAERWLMNKEDISARNHNLYATALICFGNWLRTQGRVENNAFEGMIKKNERHDRRHIRRVLSDEEIMKLLLAARMRPLDERN